MTPDSVASDRQCVPDAIGRHGLICTAAHQDGYAYCTPGNDDDGLKDMNLLLDFLWTGPSCPEHSRMT